MQNVVIKNIDLLRGFAADVFLSEVQNPIPPLQIHTEHIRVYIILIHTGKGGRVEPERRGDGHQFTKLGRKYQED
jgi:hypothetical protein